MLAEERRSAADTQLNDTTPEAPLAAFETSEWQLWPRDDCPLPSNNDWADIGSDLLPNARIAWVQMTQTKAQALETVAAFGGDDDPITDLLACWTQSAEWLRGMADMLDAAKSRLTLAWGADIASKTLEAVR